MLYTELTGWLPAHLDGATALVTLNDYLGMSIMRALRSCGLTPGADVAVVGFDNRSFAALSDPPLASVQLDESTLSAAGMDYLFSLLRQPGQPVTHRFLPLRFIPLGKSGTGALSKAQTQTIQIVTPRRAAFIRPPGGVKFVFRPGTEFRRRLGRRPLNSHSFFICTALRRASFLPAGNILSPDGNFKLDRHLNSGYNVHA